MKENWDKVHGVLSQREIVLDRYIKTTLAEFSSHDVAQEIKTFFEGKDTKGFDRGLLQAADSIKSKANYKSRDEAMVLEWLQAHGYAG